MAERLIHVRSESEIRIGAVYVIKNAESERGFLGTVRFMILGREEAPKCVNMSCGCRRYLTTLEHGAKLCAPCAINQYGLLRVDDNLDLSEGNPYLVSKPKEPAKNER